MIQVSNAEILTRVATLVGGVGVVVAVAIFTIRMKGREHDKRVAIWRRFALDNRLSLVVEPDSWLKLGGVRISGRIGELDLDLSTYRVKAGKASQTWVRVSTTGEGPAGTFNVQRANLLTRAGSALGMKSDSVDEGPFDGQFLTRSTPPSLARDVLDESLRAHLATLTRSPRFSYTDGACELNWECGEESVEQLASAVQMHAMLHGAFARMTRH